jgi:UDP-glucuronate 4-epimerase
MPNLPQRVLLTGGAGFIGSHLAEHLLRRGLNLAIIDNLDEFYPAAWKKANLAEVRQAGEYDLALADICDEKACREVFVRVQPDVVIHLAARAGVRPSIEQPLLYERVNVQGTLNLLELCREFGVRKFLFGSSSSVYGASSNAPFSEDHLDLRPISPYAATKLAGEMLCYTYAHLFDLQVICLRFFTVYGPRQRPDLAIHKFTALMEAGKPVPIFGDGSTGRDYTYIDDIVAGIIAALARQRDPGDGPAFEIFNLGNSRPVKLTELMVLLESATGHKAIRNFKNTEPGDVPLTWANISKAAKLLGYRPQVRLEEGLSRFVSWYRSTAPKRLG